MLLKLQFYANALGRHTEINVMMPKVDPSEIEQNGKLPVLFLLHGYSDDHNAWLLNTALRQILAGRRLCVVMPNGARSFYTDMAHGDRYYTLIAKELPALLEGTLPVSSKREKHFVAGLSMGGYGAFRLALGEPDYFCAAASFSGALDLARRIRREAETGGAESEMTRVFEDVFGDPMTVAGSKSDLLRLARECDASPGPSPRLYQWCGTEDFLYQDNLSFRDAVRKETALDLTYSEGPGDHSWPYWEQQLKQALVFFGF